MKRLIVLVVIVLFSVTIYGQVNDTSKTAKYQCLTVSNIMNNKIAEVWLDDGIKKKSIGVKNENGITFKNNIEVLNYVCLKYNLQLVAVNEMKNVYKFYLVKK
jgi:hypothetical protein